VLPNAHCPAGTRITIRPVASTLLEFRQHGLVVLDVFQHVHQDDGVHMAV